MSGVTMIITDSGYNVVGQALADKIKTVEVLFQEQERVAAQLVCPVSFRDSTLTVICELQAPQKLVGKKAMSADLNTSAGDTLIQTALSDVEAGKGVTLIKLNIKIG